ncbi:MAG: DUF6638 family protein [Pseudomonadota bacterium]|nr:DUF6638 family protein [Pseudomonadota bacterium]
MMRLLRSGLMYGGLVEVATPTMVGRYNRALEKLTGRRTALDSFHIDMSGFAPEIGEELGDESYLNPAGCNRQFILLTLDQAQAPLLHPHFTSSQPVLRQFFADNEATLFALTSRDPVIGELLNSVYRVTSVDEVLDLRSITVEAETVGGHVAAQQKLRALIDRFTTAEDAWYDDELVLEMIDLAGLVGDFRQTPLDLSTGPYRVSDFHTTHFGGLYVFRDSRGTSLIHSGERPRGAEAKDRRVIALSDHRAVAAFLEENGLVETVFEAAGLDERALLKQRMDFVLVDHFARTMAGWSYTGPTDLRSLAYRDADALPPLFGLLSDRVRCLEQEVRQKPLVPAAPDYFYCLRARPGPLKDLVNMLLAELAPLDARQLFMCNKPVFYKAYGGWRDAMRDYVVMVLERDYLPAKQDLRDRLFGTDEVTVWARRPGPWDRVGKGR